MTIASRQVWFQAFADELEAFVMSLPRDVVSRWERRSDEVYLKTRAATDRHRSVFLYMSPHEGEFAVGKVWGEFEEPTATGLNEILAALDALADGRVKEVRDRRTGLIYHIYRLRTRGLNKFQKDSQYSLWHWLKLRVRRVKITTLAPLKQSCG